MPGVYGDLLTWLPSQSWQQNIIRISKTCNSFIRKPLDLGLAFIMADEHQSLELKLVVFQGQKL